MGRVVAIDFGLKRTGLAVTDPLRIIATALDTVETNKLLEFLEKYLSKENVDEFVLGLPRTLKNEDSETAPAVRALAEKLKAKFEKPVFFVDERFTTTIAKQTMIASGIKKMARRDKSELDKISATLILQTHLQQTQK